MTSEKSQIKFAKSERTGELIGFVSRHSKTRQLKGVREDSRYGKQICVLSEDLKGTVEPNILYSVELKPMHKAKGYVVVAATPIQFPAKVETIIYYRTQNDKINLSLVITIYQFFSPYLSLKKIT